MFKKPIYLKKDNIDVFLDVSIFCTLYKLHRDFDLAKKIAKNGTLNWQQAESIANLCNTLISIRNANPEDFIKSEDTNSNDVIDKYKKLKEYLLIIKINFGAKKRDDIYKAVKLFYRKKYYCYQMDSYFLSLQLGYYLYINRIITWKHFINCYYYEISLFDGTKKALKLKTVVRIFLKIKQTIYDTSSKSIKSME